MQSASALFNFSSVLAAAQQNTADFKEQKQPAETEVFPLCLCLDPDVLFRDEFTSLHSTTVIYIGSAPTNEGFSPLHAQTKTEGGRSYLQFGASIKMQIVGNHFSAVTTEASSLRRSKTARRMCPPKSMRLNSLSVRRNYLILVLPL